MKFPIALTLFALLAAPTLVSAQNKQPELRSLKPGDVVKRDLKGGENHKYLIKLKAGQFLHTLIEQRGIDVIVELFSPDGKKLSEIDSPNGAHGAEPLFWITEASGEYQLLVRSLEADAAPASTKQS